MNRLLEIVRRDPVLRSLLALPTPVPAIVLRAAVARPCTCKLRDSQTTRARSAGRIDVHLSPPPTGRGVASYLDIAHRLIPELRSPFQLDRINDAGAAACGGNRDRMPLSHRGRAAGARRGAGVAPRAVARGRALPAGRSPGPLQPSCCSSSATELAPAARRLTWPPGYRPAGCLITNEPRLDSSAERLDQREPVSGECDGCQNRSPAMYMNV